MNCKLAKSPWMTLSLLFLITACSSDVAGPEGADALLASKKGFDPVPEYAYVGHADAPFVSVVDVQSMTEVTQIQVPGNSADIIAMNIAIAPNGQVAYVTDSKTLYGYGPGKLHKIDLSNNSVVETVLVDQDAGTSDVALTPDGYRAFVTLFYGKRVAAIDTRTMSVILIIPLTDANDYVNGIAMGPGGRHVFVSSQGSGRIHAIDTESLEVVATIETGCAGVNELALTQNGQFIFGIAYSDDAVVVVDAETFEVTTTISVADHPVDIAIPPSGREAYVVHYTSNLLTIIDTKKLGVEETVTVSGGPRRIGVSTSGRLAIGTNDASGEATLIDVINREVLTTVNIGGGRPWGVTFLSATIRNKP